MKQSAGILMYRSTASGVEVLLVHPSGNYNRRAPWSLPKGLPDTGETPEQAALRETREETGLEAKGTLQDLGSVKYRKSSKRILGFAAPAPAEAEPRAASWEVDGARFFPLAEAKEKIHPDQRVFVERLEEALEK